MSIAVPVLPEPPKAWTLSRAIVSTALIGVGAIALTRRFGDSAKIAVCIAMVGIGWALLKGNALHRRREGAGLGLSDARPISLIRRRQNHFPDVNQAGIAQMMPGSILWPFFILLRLRQQNKKTAAASFFLYSLSSQSFRRLSIACRWIAARNDDAQAPLQPNASPY